ncbi:MAG: phosphohydrolase [Epulopiscium sp. Nele67-Bin001]|nr:MAG: phosphohydrolase [Epulopiscium sp. Nuni2H_MBin001]OON94123.1 MAG: phosphohydrolase [Epulopiscium sp. Nele67-Bin001]
MNVIADFKPQTQIKGYYLCKVKQVLKNKNGKDFHSLKLQDATGIVDAKIWSLHNGICEYESNQILYIEGEVVLFQEQLQLNVFKLQIAKESEFDISTLIPHTRQDVKNLEDHLYMLIDEIEDCYIKALLEGIFYEDNIHDKFITHSAGKSVHHAHLNGLLEHTVAVTEIGKHLCNFYEQVNKDLVIAGCLLHDIGKLRELSGFPQNDYTDEGQLLGHIAMGYEVLIGEIAKHKDFPQELALLLKHILLSHHGEFEYGSPRRPKCIEAMIVHLADYTDSRIKMVEEFISCSNEEKYVGYHKLLNRNIRKTNYPPKNKE